MMSSLISTNFNAQNYFQQNWLSDCVKRGGGGVTSHFHRDLEVTIRGKDQGLYIESRFIWHFLFSNFLKFITEIMNIIQARCQHYAISRIYFTSLCQRHSTNLLQQHEHIAEITMLNFQNIY